MSLCWRALSSTTPDLSQARARGAEGQQRSREVVMGAGGRLPSGTVGGAVSYSLQKGHADPLVWTLCIQGLAVGGGGSLCLSSSLKFME